MEENKSVITNEFDRSGRYDAGLKALAKSLRAAFLLLLIGIIATLIYFVSGAGYFSVEPQQAVIVTRFGKVIQTCKSGGYWFLPFPVHQFIRVQTSQQLLDIDFAAAPSMNEFGDSFEPGRDNYVITGDANIVHSSWTIAYRVENPEKYYLNMLTPQFPVENGKVMPDEVFTDADGMKGTRGPVTFLRNIFRRAVIDVTAEAKVNDILYAGQSQYSENVRREFEKLLGQYDSGIVIENVGLNRIYPPVKTKAAFEEVTSAGNTSSALRNEALAYKVEQDNEARAAEASIIAAGKAYRTKVVSSLEAQSEHFNKIYEQHRLHPGTLTMALYTEMLKDIAKGMKGDKFVLGQNDPGKELWLKINREPKTSAAPKAAEDK
ncbi:MAG: protease modulator HflK [Lentisphaeria bacterium]|nr:protease modulator HflK [Lentisphaeria bacterium]